ncbi:MAG: hypothetical protein KA401_02745 [Anaerolineae bacterium]|nr:hypothetical protein [Chloroflexota bacterium]MBP6298240.1 hypothetical protein [Anaerolineae bacterium]
MPIETTWLHGKRVIKMRHSGKVSVEQLVASITDLQAMALSGVRPVHLFIDASDAEGRPEVALGDLKSLVPPTIEAIGWTVVVQPHAIQRFFTALGMQISGAKYKFVKNEQEAMNHLLEQDPTLIGVIR